MTNTSLIFEATQQITGNYECNEPPKVAPTDDPVDKAFGSSCHGAGAAPHNQTFETETVNNPNQQPYFIDPEQLFRINSPWANTQANIFQQTFKGNVEGSYSDYYQHMLQQFEQMRFVLNEQLSRYANFN